MSQRYCEQGCGENGLKHSCLIPPAQQRRIRQSCIVDNDTLLVAVLFLQRCSLLSILPTVMRSDLPLEESKKHCLAIYPAGKRERRVQQACGKQAPQDEST